MDYVEQLKLFGVDAKQIPCIKGKGTPTTATEGAVGCLYMDTDTGAVYKCTAVADGVYTWEDITRERGVYELVETITTTEKLIVIDRTVWPDGTAYNFKAMLVKFEVPPSNAEPEVGLIVVSFGNQGVSSDYFIRNTARQYCWSRIYKDFDRWQTEFSKGTSRYGTQVNRLAGVDENFTNAPIHSMTIRATTAGVPMPIGTKIQIYGVRA